MWPAEIASKDAVYVLSYAVIMLNTDQHNPQVKVRPVSNGFRVPADEQKRMTIDDFKRNLRGVNEGKDFDFEYLVSLSAVASSA